MKPTVILLLANLSVCGSSSSAPSATPPPERPKLRESLAVASHPPGPGDPIALVGRQTMMCAVRHDAPSACIGEIGLALEPEDPAREDGRYVRTHAELPVAIKGLDLRNLEANGYTRCLVDSAGAVHCWRRDVARRQGQHPAQLPFHDVRDVAAESQTCVILASGEVRCTGDETCRGPDSAPDYDMSQIVAIPGIEKARIVANAIHMGCAVREDSTVACWGKTGESGECNQEAKAVPHLDDVVDIVVDSYSACALRADNRVFCWGSNSRNTLGVLEPQRSWKPLEVREAQPATKLVETSRGFAALRTDGTIVAWGLGLLGSDHELPERLDYTRPAVDLVALSGMVCALLDNGHIECAGRKIRSAEADGRSRPPFEGKTPWVDAPVYRLAPRAGE